MTSVVWAETSLGPTGINVEETSTKYSIAAKRKRDDIASLVKCEVGNLTNIRKETVLAIVRKYHPNSVADLKRLLSQEGIRSTDKDLVEVIGQLQSEGAIVLQPFSTPGSFPSFLFDPDRSWWLYAVLIASASEVALVVENIQSGPLWLARSILGLGLLGFFPGYCTVQILFPGNRLPVLEQALLSIFLSVMISIALGVALGARYEFNGTSSVLASMAYVMVSAVIADYRQYLTPTSSFGDRSR